jgi:sulfate permease, SulP family
MGFDWKSFLDFLAIPVFFYIIIAIARVDMASLRQNGWVFDIGQSEPWWKFYTYFGMN